MKESAQLTPRLQSIEFAKLHALGNDFVLIRLRGTDPADSVLSQLSQRICNRKCGIGGDGVVFAWDLEADPDADVRARIFNADGSEAEMSGNGVRCLAALFVHQKLRSSPMRIRTLAGVKTLRLIGITRRTYTFEASMGHPKIDPASLPATIGRSPGPVLDHPLGVDGEIVPVTLLSMGNPHCSTFWPDLDEAPLERLGRGLERHAAFPNRTNVEFIQVLARDRLRVRFWERGVGPTLASGTGSCAAALAAMLHNRVDNPVTVETELGSLRVERAADGEILLTGPAELICTGRYRI